jgi:AcrR family transcriptional regulator
MARKPSIDKARLLEAAEQIIVARGAAALSFDAIAKAAGVSKGGVQNTFGTKEGLLAALYEYLDSGYQARFDSARAEGASSVDAYVDAVTTAASAVNQRIAAFSLAITQEPESRACLRAWYAQVFDQLSAATPEGRQEILRLCALEGALMLRFMDLLPLQDSDWAEEFADLRKPVQPAGQLIRQPGIAQAIDHQVHAQREHDDLPGRAAQHLAGADDRAARGHRQQQRRGHRRHGADRHAQRLQAKEADQQQHQHHPAGTEGGRVADGIGRSLELGQLIPGRDAAAKAQHQHHQAGQHRGDVDRHHHGRVGVETDLEEVGRHDVHQVGHDQWQAGGVGDETRRHHEGQRGRWGKAQCHQHGHDDGRQDERSAIVGKQRRHHRPQQHDEGKQPQAPPAPPAGHVQGCPFEESRLIQQQADEDDGDKGGRRVPHNAPNHGNVAQVHHAQQQCDGGTDGGAPADAQAARLPDNQHQGENKDQDGREHGAGLFQKNKRGTTMVVPGIGNSRSTGLAGRAVFRMGTHSPIWRHDLSERCCSRAAGYWLAEADSARAVPCRHVRASLSAGKLTNSSRRWRIRCKVWRKASSLVSSLPSPAEGSA